MNDKDKMIFQRSRVMFLNASSEPRVLDFLWRVQVWPRSDIYCQY